jgi:hypothetical protein
LQNGKGKTSKEEETSNEKDRFEQFVSKEDKHETNGDQNTGTDLYMPNKNLVFPSSMVADD